MPTHHHTGACISQEDGVLLFWAPPPKPRHGTSRAQIIDVFSLRVATGCRLDAAGRLRLEADPSLAAGRCCSIAKAAALIRHDVRPERWVALELDKRAWGLFWAGGGLQRCRDVLADQPGGAALAASRAPVTPEALLQLLAELEPLEPQPLLEPPAAVLAAVAPTLADTPASPPAAPAAVPAATASPSSPSASPWPIVAWTSLAWLLVLAVSVAGFVTALDRQDRRLQQLLDRLAPVQQPR